MNRAPVALKAMRGIVGEFALEGTLTASRPYGSGHINDTYLVTLETAGVLTRYIFQRINTHIFQDVDGLMNNIQRVTDHVRGKLAAIPGAAAARRTLTVIPTRDGRPYLRAADNACWRGYAFIEGAHTHDVLTDPRQAFEAGRTFGRFQTMLADFPVPSLREILPRFHHTPHRLQTLAAAIAADTHNRAADCAAEIAFCRARADAAATVVHDLESGALPWRVTHNDTKINNVMLDDLTGEGVAVIDLDTVMPGSLLYDFGDQMRTSIGHFAENERDLSKVFVDFDYFDQLASGFLSATRETLTPREAELLCFGGILITFTIGARFLTDHLRGDGYFRIQRPGENLDRSRTQFALVRSIEEHRERMERMVLRHLRG